MGASPVVIDDRIRELWTLHDYGQDREGALAKPSSFVS